MKELLKKKLHWKEALCRSIYGVVMKKGRAIQRWNLGYLGKRLLIGTCHLHSERARFISAVCLVHVMGPRDPLSI